MCDPDIQARRERDLERYHRKTADRRAKGLCVLDTTRPNASLDYNGQKRVSIP